MSIEATAQQPPSRQVLLVLALCPALAVSDTVVNALGLGVVAVVASVLTCITAASLRRLPDEVQWPLSVFMLAATVTCAGLVLNAWFHELHRALGIFLPLLVANVAIQLRSQESARLALSASALLGLRTGGAMALVLLVLAIARELVGRGSFLHDAGRLLGDGAPSLQIFRADMGFLLAMLPPGAFISFGLLLAARNWLRRR